MSDLDGGIPKTTFYQSHIGPVQTGVVCQVFLGDSSLGTLVSYHFRDARPGTLKEGSPPHTAPTAQILGMETALLARPSLG